ncbi:uncharacterized protein [Ptychodera flava]|uniref:uncharacterized protein n=1 Tax=Ptychodera flava TaxID=63121 RepID=UPI00396A4342
MATAEEVERFISEQKSKLAHERDHLDKRPPQAPNRPQNGYPPTSKEPNRAKKDEVGADDVTELVEGGQISPRPLPRGSYEQVRNRLNEERRQEYNKTQESNTKMDVERTININRYYDERKLDAPGYPMDEGSSIPGLKERNSAKLRMRQQRNQEYNDYLRQKEEQNRRRRALRGGGQVGAVSEPDVSPKAGSLFPQSGQLTLQPSSRLGQVNTQPSSRPSRRTPFALDFEDPVIDKMVSTNPITHEPQDHTGFRDDQKVDYRKPTKDEYSQTNQPYYEDRGQPLALPPPPPRDQGRDLTFGERPLPPRQGWRTPLDNYDELLRRKREDEARYRQYQDDPYYARQGGLRPAYSDPHIRKSFEDDDRLTNRRLDHLDQEYDVRKVRFRDEAIRGGVYNPSNAADRPNYRDVPPPRDDRDSYNWGESSLGRRRSFGEADRPGQSDVRPGARSAPIDDAGTGLNIGVGSTASAQQRKKEQYRRDLEQQMAEAREAKRREKQREKQSELAVNATGEIDPEKYPDRLRNLPPQEGKALPTTIGASQGGGLSLRDRVEPAPNLGLSKAYARSQPSSYIEQPLDLGAYPTSQMNPNDPYVYYGMRDPLDPETAKKDLTTGQIWCDEMSRSLNRTTGILMNQNADTFAVTLRRDPLDDYMKKLGKDDDWLKSDQDDGNNNTKTQQKGRNNTQGNAGLGPSKKRLTGNRKFDERKNKSSLQAPFATHSASLEGTKERQQTKGALSKPGQANTPRRAKGRVKFNYAALGSGLAGSGVRDDRSPYEVYKDFLNRKPAEPTNDKPNGPAVTGPHGVPPIYTKGPVVANGLVYPAGTLPGVVPMVPAGSSGVAGIPGAPGVSGSIYAPRGPELTKQDTASLRGDSSILNYVGDENLSPRNKKIDPKSYQQELLEQMKENEYKKKKARAEEDAYNRKLEEEARDYNPWGKGGGGAPMKDVKGNIVADLRQLHGINEEGLADPSRKQLYARAAVSPDPSPRPSNKQGSNLQQTDQPSALQLAAAFADDSKPTYGRGKIFNDDPAEVAQQKTAQDAYKEFLQRQVEEKKKRDEEEKERLRLEEEREARRLEEQRLQMQKEFEAEQEKAKKKEEEARLRNEELAKQAEENRREAERRRREEDDKKQDEMRRLEEEERNKRQAAEAASRVASPPIPTLRKKDKDATQIPAPSQSQIDPDDRPIKPGKEDIYSRPLSKENPRYQPKAQTKYVLKSKKEDKTRRAQSNLSRNSQDLEEGEALAGTWNYPGNERKTKREKSLPKSFGEKSDIPKKHAELDALDKFRLPQDTPVESPLLPRQIPLANARLSPMEKLRTHAPKRSTSPENADRVHNRDDSESVIEDVWPDGQPDHFNLVDWLRSIDPDMVFYAKRLAKEGYKSVNTLKRLDRKLALQVCRDMKLAHLEALMYEVDKLNGKKKPQPSSGEAAEIFNNIHNLDNPGEIFSDSGSILLDQYNVDWRPAAQKEQKEDSRGRQSRRPRRDTQPSALSASPDQLDFASFLANISKESDSHKRADKLREDYPHTPDSFTRDPELENLREDGRSVSPPLPAQRSRVGDNQDVIQALSAMRRQLRDEQSRIQQQLHLRDDHTRIHHQLQDRQYDSYDPPDSRYRRRTPQVDVFEMARNKEAVYPRKQATPANPQNLSEFTDLKNKGGRSRQEFRHHYPEQPSSNSVLEAQQNALIQQQEEKLEAIRRAYEKIGRTNTERDMPGMRPSDLGRGIESPSMPLPSESAFVNANTGETEIPSSPIGYKPSSARQRRRVARDSPSPKQADPMGSVTSFDVDTLAKKNRDRLENLKRLEADGDSLADPDEVLKRFMNKSSHDRPPSATSQDAWLRPSAVDA